MWQQLIQPNTAVTDGMGWCLRFTQKVWGAPARYASAWDAWEATQYKHTSRQMPPVSVPVWFSHYGTYGENGQESYGNWGHVVSWIITEQKFLSSPGNGVGQLWLNTIEEVERYFTAKYVGYSEDINGVHCAKPVQHLETKEDNKMVTLVQTNDNGWAYIWNMATNQVQDITSEQEFISLQQIFPVFKTANLGEFNASRDKYKNIFKVG